MSESNTLLTTRSTTGITTVTINRPRLRNAVDFPTARKLYDALRAFDADETQKVCILTGADGAFCAGFDLHTVSQSPLPAEPVGGSPSIAPMGPSRLRLSKPLIAAVEGHAVAGGLELALLADIRICSETAVFGVFCRRWGVPLIDGGTVRLPHIVGFGRAMDMILTGRAVDAQEALAMGLANRVGPQKCLRADRESAYYAAFDPGTFREAMQNEYVEGSKVVQAESVHGAAKFSGGAGRHGDFGGKIVAKL